MLVHIRDVLESFLLNELWAHLFTILGFAMALFLLARVVGEKKPPANTFAWLLIIILQPLIGVPLFLLFGDRKLRRVSAAKAVVCPVLPGAPPGPSEAACLPVAHTVMAAGACPPMGGNKLTLLETGEEEYALWEHHIKSAKQTIHITTFILSRDVVGKRIVDLLAQRAREGIKVRFLLDAVGCVMSSRGFVDPIRQAGGEVAKFMPVVFFTGRGSANLRSHRKIGIFDHTTAIIGGRNLAKEYMGPKPNAKRWQDFGSLVAGPAAALLNEIFIEDWCFATGQSAPALRSEMPVEVIRPVGDCELQVVASGPDVPGDPLYEGIISMIQEAEESIVIVTPYFIPDDVLLRSLIVKARAGKDVTIIVPLKSNHPLTDYARRFYTRQLRAAGAKVKHYLPRMLHAKAIVVDRKVALYGSPNFDIRSLFTNFEVGVFVHSVPDVERIKAWTDGLLLQCRDPLPEDPKKHRLIGSVLEEVSRLLAPLL